MNKTKYLLYLKNKKYMIPKKKQIICVVSERVANDLLINNQYFVFSDVSEEVFISFLEYWKDQSKTPDITPENLQEYEKISQEFEMMKDIISAQKEDHLFNIKILQNSCCYDKTNIETKISKQLDFYLDNYSDEMQKIPINSLYNIFYTKERISIHPAKAYDIISNSNDSEKYILLNSIDGISLYNESPEKFSDSLSKK